MQGKKLGRYLDKENAEIVGRILRCLRTEKKLSQKQTADLLGIAHQTYSGYETGKHEPSINQLMNLADMHNVSLDFLTGRNIMGMGGEIEENVKEFIEIDRKMRITGKHYLIYNGE